MKTKPSKLVATWLAVTLGVLSVAWLEIPSPREFGGDYYPSIYNGDFERGWDGWSWEVDKRKVDEGNYPRLVEAQGAAVWLRKSAKVWTTIDVHPGVPNTVMLNLVATHGVARRTLEWIFWGRDGDHCSGKVYTPNNNNEYDNDGWGLNTLTFTPSSSSGQLYFTGDCTCFKIVYPMGRWMK